MASRRSSRRVLEVAFVSVGCLVVNGSLAGCSSTENSDPKGASAGSSMGGHLTSMAGASSAMSGATSGSADAGSGGAGNLVGAPSGGVSGSGSGGGASVGGASVGGASVGGANVGGASVGGASVGGASGERSPEATCTRWKADTANLDEGTWSGSVDGCVVGDISADGRANALRFFNLIRWLADLPAVVTEDARNQQAQACALMMTANEMLSHDPPMSWACYSALGHDGASTSNISGGPGVSSVLGYMVDTGNETTFGHRRIILSNELGPIGLGSAGKGGSSCMQNIGGKGKAGKPWLAWPPPGAFPMQAYADSYRRSLDDSGWSIQATTQGPKLNLSAAQVTVTSGGQSKPVKVEQLTGTYGQATAIRIVLDGWKAVAGSSYSVTVTGAAVPIAYEFQLVDCK